MIAPVDVRKPTVIKAEISAVVKAVPDIVVDVGFAFMTKLYFTDRALGIEKSKNDAYAYT